MAMGGRIAIVIFALAYFALWACLPAPASTFRSPAPRPPPSPDSPFASSVEVGLGMAFLEPGGEAHVDDVTGMVPEVETFRAGQLWLSFRGPNQAGELVLFGYRSPLGYFNPYGPDAIRAATVGLGGGLRTWLYEGEWFRSAIDLDFHLVGGGLALPFGVRVIEGLWLYSSPGFAGTLWGLGTFRAPLGAAIQLGCHARLELEAAALYVAGGSQENPAIYAFQPSYYGGGAFVVSF